MCCLQLMLFYVDFWLVIVVLGCCLCLRYAGLNLLVYILFGFPLMNDAI